MNLYILYDTVNEVHTLVYEIDNLYYDIYWEEHIGGIFFKWDYELIEGKLKKL